MSTHLGRDEVVAMILTKEDTKEAQDHLHKVVDLQTVYNFINENCSKRDSNNG